MKKVKLTPLQYRNVQLFYRFLKEYSLYGDFIKDFITYRKGVSFVSFIKDFNIRIGGYFVDTVMGYGIVNDKWVEPDNKWMIYLYNNKFYGTTSTISKRKLLDSIKDIIEIFHECEETVNEAKRICDIEYIRYKVN